jgi:hypothetical protein
MDQGFRREEGSFGLVALDVHADQTVGVESGAGQLLDLAGGWECACFVPELWERLKVETPAWTDERGVPGLEIGRASCRERVSTRV